MACGPLYPAMPPSQQQGLATQPSTFVFTGSSTFSHSISSVHLRSHARMPMRWSQQPARMRWRRRIQPRGARRLRHAIAAAGSHGTPPRDPERCHRSVPACPECHPPGSPRPARESLSAWQRHDKRVGNHRPSHHPPPVHVRSARPMRSRPLCRAGSSCPATASACSPHLPSCHGAYPARFGA